MGTDLETRYAALRERTSQLTAAILRVNASLDLDTVLREAVDGARTLTGARLGIIAAVDSSGRPSHHVMSGFDDDEIRMVLGLPGARGFFEHLRDLPSPLRQQDFAAYARSIGYDWDLPATWKAFQAASMRHRGTLVGCFFLAAKTTGGFTDDDEEILLLFASQAAAAIANARTHSAERRARADLEALVETSPVGVVVFDAASGRPVSLNREAARIVSRLRIPNRPLEELLNVVVYRRADGREINLGEFPITLGLKSGEKVHAEEIVISVPGGASVSVLINATPIAAADGEAIESVVVTMQDLEPLRELERQRAEFLGIVSHELRAPLAAIKGCAATVLGGLDELDPAETRQFFHIVDTEADRMRALVRDLLDAGRIETGTLSVAPEPADLAGLVDEARNTFARGGGRHPLHIDLPLDLPRVAADPLRIVQVLNNLFANAARHSPVSSPIRISAAVEGSHATVVVADRGEGMSPERLAGLFSKHTALTDATGRSGAGLGLMICRGIVEAHGGRIQAHSAGPDHGATVTFTLPLSETDIAAHPGRAGVGPSVHAPATVLIVDDDPNALRHMRDALAGAGYEPIVTGDPRETRTLVRTKRPQLVILDLMLPGSDGIELMNAIPELEDVPVIFVSGFGRDETVSEALGAGAVDYIVKPFSATELVARARAALRRGDDPAVFAVEGLAINFDTRSVTVGGRAVELTATEYELLRVLALNAGRVCTYDALLRRVWGGRDTGSAELVRTFMTKLRRKLGDDAASPVWISNERAVGYRLRAADTA